MPKRPTGNIKRQILFPPAQLRGLELLARGAGNSVSEQVREAVRDHLFSNREAIARLLKADAK